MAKNSLKTSTMNLVTKISKEWFCTKPFLLITLFFYNNSIAQTQYNLVKNYSFEDYVVCPSANNPAPPPPWYSAGKAYTATYINACNPDLSYTVPTNGSGYQYARTGNGYIGLYFINGLNQNNRNYLQAKLKDSLYNQHSYYIEFFANLGNTQKYACNNVGLLLTNNAVYVDTLAHPLGVLPANPQILNYGNPVITDTLNWVKVSAIYKAQGGEQYITIGNFKTDAQTSYKQVQPTGYNGSAYFIDDVSVIPLDSFCLKADAGRDTTIAQGDSVFIGSYTNGLDSVKWFVNGTTLIDSIRPGFWVKPNASTFYILQQVVNGCYSADTVYINVNPLPLTVVDYKLLIIDETRNGINQKQVTNNWTTANEINVSHFNIQRSIYGKDFTTIGKIKAQNKLANEYSFIDETPNDGLNYYKIESVDFDGRKQYSETRILNFKPQTFNGISIYPNPAKDLVSIDSKGIQQIKIINQLGQTLMQINNSTEHQTINTKQFTKGLYIVQCTTNKGEINTQKLIIE